MRKIWIVAVRDYRAVVQSRAFLISMLMMPLLMGGSLVITWVMKKLDDTSEKHFAIVDRTPGQSLFQALEAAAQVRNKSDIFDPDTGKEIKPVFLLERIEPSANTPEAMARQRYDLSQDMLAGKYYGLLEIGSDVPKVEPLKLAALKTTSAADLMARSTTADKIEDRLKLRYQTKTPQNFAFSQWALVVVNTAVQTRRWTDAKQPLATVFGILQPVQLVTKGLTRRDPETGAIEDARTESQQLHFILPAALCAAMFFMIMIGATPLVGSVLEEKMGRIAEVLLGSIEPFQLMLGKLLGIIGVSCTILVVYAGGAYWSAYKYGFTDMLTWWILSWFALYMLLAVLMYGSIFIAIGAACTTGSETQSMLAPVTMLAVIPLLALIPIVTEPNSLFATLLSFFPPSTPMVMIARMSVPPGIPLWQPILGIVVTLAFTLACVHAAGRIFRVGILWLGKGPRFGELWRWLWRG